MLETVIAAASIAIFEEFKGAHEIALVCRIEQAGHVLELLAHRHARVDRLGRDRFKRRSDFLVRARMK